MTTIENSLTNTNTTTYTPGYLLACTSCLNQYRAECINHLLTDLPKYCPYCGAKTIRRSFDKDRDYWFTLAEGLGLARNQECASLVKDIFEEWPREEYHKFRDYYEAVMNTETTDDNAVGGTE